MSDAFDDWEQADEIEIDAPVAVPAPIKKKIAILSRPTSAPGSPGPIGPALGGSTGMPGSPGESIGRIGGGGGGGGVPMILKRNPGSNSSGGGGGSAGQHGSSSSGQGSPATFSRENSPFGDNYSNSSNSGRRSGAPSMDRGYQEEDPDLVSENALRRQMEGMSLRERNRALWDQANTYEQPIIARADTTRTEYVPEIRILRRPKSPVQAVRVSNQAKSKPLAQREADYNAAREKIFGPSPTPTSPSPSSPNNNNSNDDTTTTTTSTTITTTTTSTTGSRTYSGGSGGSPRRQSPSVGGGVVVGGGGSSSSPNSRPSSRPSSRPASPSQPHQAVQIFTAESSSSTGSNSGGFESALENVKPIEFRGGPPPSRRGGGNNGGRRTGGQENVNTAIRQPLGPTTASSGHSGSSGSKPRGRGRGRGGGGAGGSSSGSGSGTRSTGEGSGAGGGGGDGGSAARQEGSIGFRRPMGRGGSSQPRPPPLS